jgi:hypothetical protein
LRLASKHHVHSVKYAAKLVHTRRALSSTNINSRQETLSGQKPVTLLIPIDLFLSLLVEEFYGTRYQSGSFSFITHCLRKFSFFRYKT